MQKYQCAAKLEGGKVCQRPATIKADGELWCALHSPDARRQRAAARPKESK